jgi:hypothetical protein
MILTYTYKLYLNASQELCRDHAAAQVILARALRGNGGDSLVEESTSAVPLCGVGKSIR